MYLNVTGYRSERAGKRHDCHFATDEKANSGMYQPELAEEQLTFSPTLKLLVFSTFSFSPGIIL